MAHAAGGQNNGPAPRVEDNELYLNLCKLKELFRGRYSTEEAAVIFQHTEGHLDRAVRFILENEPATIRQILETDMNSWTTIESKTRRMKKESSILERARLGKIDTTARQFACGPCDSSWWRRCPSRKEVARCKKCRVRYEPVPREKEWGWAEFKCPHPGCGREFGGWCAMTSTSPCFGCRRPIRPSRVLPPNNKERRQNNRNTHRCDGVDCPGNGRRIMNHYGVNPPMCVHPYTRTVNGLPKVIHPSEPHDSTGSTVDTFLSQSDFAKDQEEFYQTLATVAEEGSDGSVSGNPGSDNDDDDGDSQGPPAAGLVGQHPTLNQAPVGTPAQPPVGTPAQPPVGTPAGGPRA